MSLDFEEDAFDLLDKSGRPWFVAVMMKKEDTEDHESGIVRLTASVDISLSDLNHIKNAIEQRINRNK